MLDVHPPHAATHTWNDFFIHIATIDIGLLIAVGLEQTVEATRKHSERVELRLALHEESEKILKDSSLTHEILTIRESLINVRMEEVQVILFPAPATLRAGTAVSPPVLQRLDIPIWRTARTSGLAALLNYEEIGAYSEVEMISTKVELAYDRMVAAHTLRTAFEREYPGALVDPVPAMSSAASATIDLRQYLHLLSHEGTAIAYLDAIIAGMSGAESAILHGTSHINDIRRSEQEQQSTHKL